MNDQSMTDLNLKECRVHKLTVLSRGRDSCQILKRKGWKRKDKKVNRDSMSSIHSHLQRIQIKNRALDWVTPPAKMIKIISRPKQTKQFKKNHRLQHINHQQHRKITRQLGELLNCRLRKQEPSLRQLQMSLHHCTILRPLKLIMRVRP